MIDPYQNLMRSTTNPRTNIFNSLLETSEERKPVFGGGKLKRFYMGDKENAVKCDRYENISKTPPPNKLFCHIRSLGKTEVKPCVKPKQNEYVGLNSHLKTLRKIESGSS